MGFYFDCLKYFHALAHHQNQNSMAELGLGKQFSFMFCFQTPIYYLHSTDSEKSSKRKSTEYMAFCALEAALF